jgi:hypothetical protein
MSRHPATPAHAQPPRLVAPLLAVLLALGALGGAFALDQGAERQRDVALLLGSASLFDLLPGTAAGSVDI